MIFGNKYSHIKVYKPYVSIKVLNNVHKMRVLGKNIREGRLKIQVESLDDLWYLSQVIEGGDTVRMKTQRRIKDSADSIRSTGGKKMTFTLSVLVDKNEFKPEHDVLRISGTINEGPGDLVSLGSHHTLNVETQDTLTVVKPKLTKPTLERIRQAEGASLRPKVLVLILQEGEATLGLIHESRITYSELNANLGGKYYAQDRGKNKKKFYDKIIETLNRTLTSENIQAVVVAGPGFEKNYFKKHVEEKKPPWINNMRFDESSMGGRQGVSEIIKRDAYKKILQEVSSVREEAYIEEILKEIGKDKGKVAYSLKEVEAAVNANAVKLLLVTDTLYTEKRGEIEHLLMRVKNTKGKTHIINHENPAGFKLKSLGGVAATLRFSLG
ncbi:MAG: mRNA surveillance protein pelota [Candidatus Altiarchaeales archaeon]|nr:mRNA surveillance protein pelota [Candidatus Altiarchaeales archaeon]